MKERLVEHLTARLCQPLPGAAARGAFAPQLSYGRHEGPPPHDARRAAVLLLLFDDGGTWRIPLTVRPAHLPSHGGQISLPGGQLDAGETVEEAARRELHEELGVDPPDLELLGRLTPIYVSASNFLVTPVVAATATRPAFRPHSDEVANLLTPALVELFHARARTQVTIERYGVRFQAPAFEYRDHHVWGATCMVLAELQAVVAD